MNNLSFHITDIAVNSVRANASEISLHIEISQEIIKIQIADNGCGMDAETLLRITDPFYTTRTTRKVGLGIPFLIQNAEQTGGSVSITSQPGEGTTVTAFFISSHIDCPPWGDLAGTVAMLISGYPDINISFSFESEEMSYRITSREIKEVLDGIPLNHPKIILLIKELIQANTGI